MSGADTILAPRRLTGDAIRLALRHARGQRTAALLSTVGALSFATTIVVSAQVIGWVTEQVILPALVEGTSGTATVGTAAAVLGAVAAWRATSIVLRRASAAWWQLRSEQGLRREVVVHQLGLSLRWYASRGVGDLLAVSGSDTKKATGLLAPLPFALGSLFLLVGAMALVLTIDVRLGLIAGAVMALVVAIDAVGSWSAFRNMERVQQAIGRLSTVAHESFDGVLTIRALGREQEEIERLRVASEEHRDAVVRLGWSWTAFRAVTDLAPTLGTIAILTLATSRAATGDVAPSELVTIAYLLSLLVVPTRLIGYLIWDAAQSVAGWRRVRTVLDVTDRPTYGTLTLPVRDGGASVAVESAHFAYAPGRPVLSDVSLAFAAGRTCAIVGPTGSGKSTLARLLARLWDPDAGRVLLDGVDVRDLAPGVVAASVAYVAQEPFVFDDSVRGNITLGDPDISDTDVDRALRLSRLDEVVAALPAGLDTRVGERGTTLSGGQQQRLGLARALARRPRVLVLDDATSAIDAEVEAEILDALRRSAQDGGRQDMTVVLVAARLSTIMLADEVVHLADGEVLDHGPHDELVARSERYAALVEAYAREAAER